MIKFVENDVNNFLINERTSRMKMEFLRSFQNSNYIIMPKCGKHRMFLAHSNIASNAISWTKLCVFFFNLATFWRPRFSVEDFCAFFWMRFQRDSYLPKGGVEKYLAFGSSSSKFLEGRRSLRQRGRERERERERERAREADRAHWPGASGLWLRNDPRWTESAAQPKCTAEDRRLSAGSEIHGARF